MGFGFNLFFVFILLPLTIIFSILRLVLGTKKIAKILAYTWAAIAGLCILSVTINSLTSKKELNRDEIFGEYVIDRSKFSGRQADWQYNHFRFQITNQNKFLFLQTENEKILKTSKLDISFLDAYKQPRINLHVDTARHHIIEDNPTLYRTTWGFYYVFHSSKFGNVFFKKAKWKPID